MSALVHRQFAICRPARRRGEILRRPQHSDVGTSRTTRLTAASELTFNRKGVDIFIDPFTGRNPSYCFIDFDSEEDAANALQTITGQDLYGRPIKVKPATVKRKPAHFGPTRSSWWTQAFNEPNQNTEPYAFNRWSQYDTAEAWTAPPNEDRRLYVGGLPRLPNQATLNVQMRELFRDHNVQAVSKMISPHPSTKSKPGHHHYCFVDFATVGDARQAALALNGRATPYGGRYRVSQSYKLPSKLIREQLGGVWPEAEQVQRERNLEGNWRRVEN